jgi:hypothetical protein
MSWVCSLALTVLQLSFLSSPVIFCDLLPFTVGCIEDLREKREELNRSILRDEEEKGKIQKVWLSCESIAVDFAASSKRERQHPDCRISAC